MQHASNWEKKRNKSCRINSAIKSKTFARDLVVFCTGLQLCLILLLGFSWNPYPALSFFIMRLTSVSWFIASCTNNKLARRSEITGTIWSS